MFFWEYEGGGGQGWGRPREGWENDLARHIGADWKAAAQDRAGWRRALDLQPFGTFGIPRFCCCCVFLNGCLPAKESFAPGTLCFFMFLLGRSPFLHNLSDSELDSVRYD